MILPVGDPDPEVTLTPDVGDMLQLELEMLDPDREKLVVLPVLMLPPALLATDRPLGVGHGGVVDTVTDAVAFAVAVIQEPVELAT